MHSRPRSRGSTRGRPRHRRIEGLRLITAFGIAASLGTLQDITSELPGSARRSVRSRGVARSWNAAAVLGSARPAPMVEPRDLALLCAAGALGVAVFILLAPLHLAAGRPRGSELTLVTRPPSRSAIWSVSACSARGIGSQFFIGDCSSCACGSCRADLPDSGCRRHDRGGGVVVPRMLSGPAEPSASVAALAPVAVQNAAGSSRRNSSMGWCRPPDGALVVIALGATVTAWRNPPGRSRPALMSSRARRPAQLERVRRSRIIGTLIGVPLGLACLPVTVRPHCWSGRVAALAMVTSTRWRCPSATTSRARPPSPSR